MVISLDVSCLPFYTPAFLYPALTQSLEPVTAKGYTSVDHSYTRTDVPSPLIVGDYITTRQYGGEVYCFHLAASLLTRINFFRYSRYNPEIPNQYDPR